MTLLERLGERIGASGPIPFEEFMAACLYDPDGGFFATGPLRSVKAGDFLTSPEVSPWFGRMLSTFIASERKTLNASGFVVADVGAGSGSLLAPVAEAMGDGGTEIWAVEASPAARAALGSNRGWTVVEDFTDLPDAFTGVILANELLDNLPVSLAVRTPGGWQERYVGTDDEQLVLVPVEARPEVAAWADAHGGVVPDGGMVEVQLAAGRWLESALRRIEAGTIVVIDYGGTAEELEPRRTQGTLRTYRAHHLGPDPLLEPGMTDVTVDVNFSALVAIAESCGAAVEVQRQDDFLAALGLRDEIGRMRHEELELARGSDAMARLQVRSERTAAETLLHPRGLGGFRVLVARKARPET